MNTITKEQEMLPACLYSLGRELGEGGYSTVNICQHLESHIKFAVKILPGDDVVAVMICSFVFCLELLLILLKFDQEVCLLKKLQDIEGPFIKMVDLFRTKGKS